MTAQTRCPRCETRLPGSLRFCDVCGEDLPRAPPVPPRPGNAEVRLRRACGFWVELHRVLEHDSPERVATRALHSVREYHPLGDVTPGRVKDWVQRATAQPVSLLLAAESLSAGLSPTEREDLYEAACDLAWRDDGRMSGRERQALRFVGQAMGLDEPFQRGLILRRFGLVAVCEYVLEVSREASLQEVAVAHRRVRSSRVDELSRRDLSEAHRRRIKAELAIIDSAHEQLLTALGLRGP